MTIDILFTASTHRSVANAIRMAESLAWIDGQTMLVLTGDSLDELAEIDRANTGATLLHSQRDNLYFNRAAGLIWAGWHGVQARYLCSCDDDLEFTEESRDLVQILDKASEMTEFGVMTFNNHSHRYDGFSDDIQGDLRVGVRWINGDSMFVPWPYVVRFGLPDSLPDVPVTYFSEIEYQHRIRALTGRPIVAACGKQAYYVHHFREPGPITTDRATRAMDGIAAGSEFWRRKYGVDVDAGDWHKYPELFEVVKAAGDEARRHLIFGGLAAPGWPQIGAREIGLIHPLEELVWPASRRDGGDPTESPA